MFTIQSNIAVTGKHWGLDFTAGVSHTDNAALADKLRRKGYVVTNESQAVPDVKKVPEKHPVTAKKPTGKKAVKDRVSDS